MEQIVKALREAAADGSTPSLLNLLEKDRLVLDRCMSISYGETPLHVAAMLGHLKFCIELLRRKPELAKELDSRRSSALHLASANGFTDVVKALVSIRPKMSFAYDEDGNTPIHVAAMKGRVEVLKGLVDIQPDAAHRRVEMCQGETVLHLCVQYSQLEALRFLVENINDEELLNAKDDNGNSILHLAVFDKQVQIVNYLLENTKIDVDARNSSGLTALDILSQTRRDSKYIDIAHRLHNYVSQSSKGILSSLQQEAKYPSRRYNLNLRKSRNKKKSSTLNKSESLLDKQTSWLEKQRNSLMVVASLIATMGFQAALTPPGGFWQDDVKFDFEGNNISGTNNQPDIILYAAGNSIFADKYPDAYKIFMISNTMGFISSLSVILLLVSGLPYTRKVFMWLLMVIMWISISAMAFTYSMSIVASITASRNGSIDLFSKMLPVIIVGWFVLMALLNLMHTIRLISHFMRSWSSKKRVIMWTSMAILWILITSLRSSSMIASSYMEVSMYSKFGKNYYVYLNVFVVVTIGWLALWTIFGVAILLGVVLIIIKKLMRYFRRIKGLIKSSGDHQDSTFVV